MIKVCPRCRGTFECKNDDIMNCDCLKVPLTLKDREYIAKSYIECLCNNCLTELQKERMNFKL